MNWGGMDVTIWTIVIAVVGLMIAGVLLAAQLVAGIRPKSRWTIDNIYGGSPERSILFPASIELIPTTDT
jgi:hypothetical protein